MNRPVEIIFDVAPVERRRTRKHCGLPERLTGVWSRVLLAVDAVSALCVALLTFDPQQRPAALAFTGLVLAAFAALGMYRRSFAVRPRDEFYGCAVAFAFVLVPVIFLMIPFGVSPLRALFTSLLTGFVLSALRMLMTTARRGGEENEDAGIQFIGGDAAEHVASSRFEAMQRAFDLVASTIGIVVFSPLLLALAVIVYFDSGAPILFRQERVGRLGRPFIILKFRTMRAGADGEWARPGDKRITRIGAFLRRSSLDELPQLFNVLRGDMSIVGPRPEMTSFAQRFELEIPHYHERHFVRPGITGWAQVYLKRNLQPSDMPNVLPYDLFYVEHASLFLNGIIVLKTAAEVLFHRAV